jgi:1-acyl-sn-glycerol-3-phosphate acyltransferase
MLVLVRSLVFFAYLSVTVLVYAVPVGLFGRLLNHRGASALGRGWGRSVLWGLKLICGLDYRVQGLETIPEGGAIVLCKHQSAWETIALRAIFPVSQTWVLKRELFRVPLFGWALRQFEPIAIDRSAGRRAVVQLLVEGRRALDAGRLVVVFPEGTRVPPGERRPYAIGGALLAERTGRPVYPVAHNAGVFWARRGLLKRPGTIELRIGPPIDPAGLKAEEINRLAEDWIESTVAALPGPAVPAAETSHA